MASPWTDECETTLKSIWESHSCSQIVGVLWERHHAVISRNAVIGKLHRLGLHKGQQAVRPRIARRYRNPAPKPHRVMPSLPTPEPLAQLFSPRPLLVVHGPQKYIA